MALFTFGWLFTGRYPWILTAFCALDWYLVNLMNRIADLREDEANQIVETGFVSRYRRRLLQTALGVLIFSLLLSHLIKPAITGLRVVCHLLGAFYNWPLLPGKRRIKQLYFWKNNASAFGFLLTVFGYPLADAAYTNTLYPFPPDIGWRTVAVCAAFFFLFEVSYEIVYDLRDVDGDARAGIQTYPVVHGITATVWLVDGLLWVSAAVLAAGYAAAVVPWRIFVMIGAPVVQYTAFQLSLGRGVSARDCVCMTWLGVGMFVIYHFWIVAGLPWTDF